MRILALHGSGASSAIFETQLAPLLALLPPSLIIDFVDAPNECAAAPELQGIYPGPYYCFFERYSAEEMKAAVEFVEEVVEEDGPYDVIMGFSQGATVAAAYLASTHAAASAIGLGVFICSALIPPAVAKVGDNLARTIGSLGLVPIPTVHVIGQRDLCYAQSTELVKSCDVSSAQVVYHSGGHEPPKSKADTKKAAEAIEKGVRVAFWG